MSEMIGKVLEGKYQLLRLLGEGGMGEVYEAEHLVLKRHAAVKVMRAELASDASILERFIREAQAASAIGHPNIIDIQDIGRAPDGSVFLVMELLKGQSLERLLEEGGRLSQRRSVSIILQVLSALVATHAKGIIHRDLKPDNIFLSSDARGREEVKLLDFGASKIREGEGDNVKLTRTGTVIGTPLYLSPEQAKGVLDIDHRVDIWAAGVVLYQMLGGSLPYHGETYNQILAKILLEPIPPLADRVADLDPRLDAIVRRALAKEPADRYQSAAEMIGVLFAFHDSGDNSISTRSLKVLRSSLAPPLAGYADESPAEDELSEVAAPTANASATLRLPSEKQLLVVAPTEQMTIPLPSELKYTKTEIANTHPEGTTAATRERNIGRALFVVFVVLVMIGAFITGLSFRDEFPAELRRLIGSEQDSSSSAARPPLPHPEPAIAVAPSPALAPASTSANKAAAKQPAPAQVASPAPSTKKAKTVSIKLAGAPHGAKATLGSKPVDIPIEVERTSKPQQLVVKAEGYLPFTAKVVPLRDRTVKVTMKRDPRAKKPSLEKSKRSADRRR